MKKLQEELNALGVDVNATDYDGCTALMAADINNNVEVKKVLIAAGADADVNIKATDDEIQ